MILPVLLLLTAAGADPPAHTRVAPAPGASKLTDTQLEKTIRDKFAASKISQDHFTVRVSGGVATLEGMTQVVQRKGVATRLARTAGAKKVVNNIQISEEARRKASENLTQGRRRAQIKRGEKR